MGSCSLVFLIILPSFLTSQTIIREISQKPSYLLSKSVFLSPDSSVNPFYDTSLERRSAGRRRREIESADNYTFKYIRHPQSYRTTLIQIANDGWEAFSQAHSSMNTIQLFMTQIPRHIKTSLKILVSASPRLLERMLIQSLNDIDQIGRECSKLASNTHDQFVSVMQLLGEVIEMTVLTQSVNMQKLQAAEIELNVSRIAQQQQKQISDIVQKHYSGAQESVRKAQAAYIKALEELPTG
ncbi:unnamed protein product [Didymodactylos carnosus]|uniref:Uncharacterized protein n=1 Tax=Didymodactylos carnosus TaxID=1234261 RepID=A0A815TQ65_9BILA|nr:unnamed protein product [Didymodactylos carnosus]CAF4370591.1 unnamed protein product [Didymodactylos carnosus]